VSRAEPLSVAVAGAGGRMGGELIRLIAADPERYRLSAAWTAAGSEAIGRDAGELAGIAPTGIACGPTGGDESAPDVVVDFSTAGACAEVARAAVAAGAALVCGTTGLDRDAEAALDDAAGRVPVLHAANFSLGVAVLAELAATARRRLGGDFDAEILEVHHRGKRDAPSGTARMLAKTLGDADASIRTGARQGGEVGCAVVRGGGVAGDHTVFFLGPHERLELVHRAGSRTVFADGALKVARWLAGCERGRYRLKDFLDRRAD